MNATQLKKRLRLHGLDAYAALYADIPAQTERYIHAIDAFVALYGDHDDIRLFSVPGRSELGGNHTDHNHGRVLAAAIDRDIIAVAVATDDGMGRIHSEGYPEDAVSLSDIDSPDAFENYTSRALLAGVCAGMKQRGYRVGGLCAYTTTEVLKGSGISSSAAFEVQCANLLSGLYNEGRVPADELAKIAQYAENVYFGKPCGLMDQMACAVGGSVAIDFAVPESPVIEPIACPLSEQGYSLCIVNTGGSHENLNEEYAAIPAEMKAVAATFGEETLRPLSEAKIIAAIPTLRKSVGDRAILRALHFFRENQRVVRETAALRRADIPAFLAEVRESGRSSFEYLQNVFHMHNPAEQGLSLALALTDGYLAGSGCAWRVHGGGFAGTIQAFVREAVVDGYVEMMDCIFGAGSVMRLRVRPVGACEIAL